MGAAAGSGRALAIFALSFVAVYDFGRYLSHQRAIEILNSRIYRGEVPLRVAAFPDSASNPFRWSGWVETHDASEHFSVNVLGSFDPASGTVIYKPEPSDALDAARRNHLIEEFLKFARYPLWRVTPMADPEGARRVDVSDWRFPFTATAVVDASNRVLSSSFHF
jgi:hypothetical protein